MAEGGTDVDRQPVVLGPGGGRPYPMGRILAVFKADGVESGHGYSISEWWLEPRTKGPGAHSHPEDDVFYVLDGTMSILIGTRWVEAEAGSFVLVPGTVVHDFENRAVCAPGCSTSPPPGTSNGRCRTSPGGSSTIHRATRPNGARWADSGHRRHL